MNHLRKESLIKLSDDRWPLYTTKAQRKLQPTGKWRVPRQDNLTRTDVLLFFSRFGATPNVQQKEDFFLVYMIGAWSMPPPSTQFTCGTLIRNWHITEQDYWETLRRCDDEFRRASTYEPGTRLCMEISRGSQVYPGNILGLPPLNAMESFSYKIRDANVTTVTVILDKEHYYTYIQGVIHSHNPQQLPLIRCSMVEADRMKIQLLYTVENASGWIQACVTPNGFNLKDCEMSIEFS
jgi:hypothetical protein